MEYRALGDELVPVPRQGEFIVFAAHFSRGFGLPMSPFFRAFVDSSHFSPIT